MNQSVQFTQSPKQSDFVKCAFYSLFSKASFWVYAITITVIYAVLYYFVGKIDNALLYDTILNCAYFLLLLGPISLRYWIADCSYAEFVKEGGNVEISYVVSDEGIRIKTKQTDQLWRWDGIDYVFIANKYIFIVLNGTKNRLVIFRERIPDHANWKLSEILRVSPAKIRYSRRLDMRSLNHPPPLHPTAP